MARAFVSRFDWALLVGAVFLMLLGLLSITSTSVPGSAKPLLQASYIASGLLLFFLVSFYEYRTLKSYAPLIYFIGIISLVLVLFFGVERNGSKAWFDLGIAAIQPSEPMKIAVILMLASAFSSRTRHSLKDVWRTSWTLIPVLFLILEQPDLGTALVYIVIWMTMLIGLNLRTRDLTMLIGSAILLFTILIGALMLLLPQDNYQTKRLAVYPDHLMLKDIRHSEIGYQVDQSLIAIGSAETFFGSGLGKGNQVHLGFLPAAQTDFIFAAIAEELGLFGVMILLILYGIVLFRILKIANSSIDSFGSFICLGVFAMLIFHLIENVGMNIGLMPVTGVPLLLVSSGGSHLLTTLIGLGLVESISLRAQRIKY